MNPESGLPYFFHLQGRFTEFWKDYGTRDRHVLFVHGVGFDPRCVPALRSAVRLFGDAASVTTVCARFTNLFDRKLAENQQHTRECLNQLREAGDALSSTIARHFEIEVNLFDVNEELVGDRLLFDEFSAACGSLLHQSTDIIVDVSAFPRSLIYTIVADLWNRRQPGQNLFAVLTEVPVNVTIEESDLAKPVLLFSEDRDIAPNGCIWIPVLGGDVNRLRRIYDKLAPKAVLPIVPFPSADPRSGDEICLAARVMFDEWGVPFKNVMYASGDVPFDVFRKIHDAIESYREILGDLPVVVSALSGRSLSLGVLLAALRHRLAICHTQPATYTISVETRNALLDACATADPMIYWLAGRLYEDRV